VTIAVFLTFGSTSLLKFANAQQQPTCTNGKIRSGGTILPVILLHGYDELISKLT